MEETTEDDPSGFPPTTIESVLSKSGFDRTGILKPALEGTEKEIFLDHFKKWIDKEDLLIIELHDRLKSGCSLAFFSAIDAYDFVQ